MRERYFELPPLAGRRPTRTGHTLAMIVWNGWRWEGRRALPSLATITALLVLLTHEHERSKFLITLRGQTKACLYGPGDCSAHVRQLYH